jgi:ABC-2 type transport system permease protein
MPIYDQGYRAYEARGGLRRVRFWPITREALRLLLGRKAFLGLLALCWLPFVGFTIYIYAVTRFSGMVGDELQRLLAVDGVFFMRFFAWQLPLAMLVTVFAGAGLIAHDLRTGAILIYLSRPLTRRDYVLGKFLTLAALNASVTLLPALLLYLVGLALVSDQLLTAKQAHLAPATLGVGLLITVTLSLLMLAVSSLSKSARVAGLSFFALLMGLEVLRGLVWLAYRTRWATLVSVQGTLREVGNAFFLVPQRTLGLPWPAGVALLLAVSVACLFVLRARVRAVEVVA